jgi:hypothetical protein
MSDNVVPHPAIDPSELYDGPQPPERAASPQPTFTRQAAAGAASVKQQMLQAQIVATVRVALSTLAARLLGFIATATACGVWSYAVINPDTARTVAACCFSVTVLAPVIVMYLRKG